MVEGLLDFLLSDDSSPTLDDLLHPTNESIQLNQKMLESSSALSGENKPDLWDNVAELQQAEEHFACRHSVNMLPQTEPEKEKALERKGIWSEEEKRLFLSGLEKYGPSKWKDICRHIGTRTSDQVRSYDRRRRRKLTTGDQEKGLLSPGELSKYGRDRDPIPAYRNERQYEVQGLDKNDEKKKVHDSNNVKGQEILPEPEPEKEKTSDRKGIWSEEEKGLFELALEVYGSDPGKWKKIARYIGTRSSEQARSFSKRKQKSMKKDLQSLPPETNRAIANPRHQPLPWTVYVPIMEPRVQGPNVPPPIRTDLALLRPEHDLHYIYGNFGGPVCQPSGNFWAEMGANPSSRISDPVLNSTSTLLSDSCACLPGPSAYGNNMYPGQ